MKTALSRLGILSLFALLAACGGAASAPATTGNGSAGGVTKETLVWSDEFNGATAPAAPNRLNWTYDTGAGGWGNSELETYCAYGSSTAPCDPSNPNVYVGTDGYLHIVARNPASGVYTSARLKSQGLQSFQYGRIEARIKMPAGQGMWPAFWMLGDNITTHPWPACGEMDIMENIGSQPSINHGSIHGTGFTGSAIGTAYTLTSGQKFSDGFHTFGIVWSPKSIKFYVDSPTNVYATYTPASLPQGAVWPFDDGKFFFILNTAIGGAWPGSPDKTTVFPQEMLIDYVRVYAEPAS
ncbi:MAG: glycoside hydrolase family 16 protein [Acidobacteriaceae bacterium]